MTSLRDLTADEINHLAAIIAKLRPHGARRWDARGVYEQFAKIPELDAAEAIKAAIRLAQDRTAFTPGQIAILNSECWRERLTDLTPHPNQRRYCPTHDVTLNGLGICPSCRADELGSDGPAPRARPSRGLPPEQVADVVDELRDHLHSASTTTKETR